MRALEEIVADYGPALGRVAASYEADRMLREDLTQEIMIAIHRALAEHSPIRTSAGRPSIFRIAHNRGVTHVAQPGRAPGAPNSNVARIGSRDTLPETPEETTARRRAGEPRDGRRSTACPCPTGRS